MLDINLIREQPDKIKEGVQKKNIDPKLVDKFIRLDEQWRAKTAILDQLKTEQNLLSKELAENHREEALSKAQVLKKRITDVSAERGEVEGKRDEILEQLPNIPFDDVPVGKDASENRVVREEGEKPAFTFAPKDYLVLGEALGIVDTKRAAEVAGTRFGYLMGDAVLLEFALVKLAFETLVADGFTPVVPPVMIRPKVFAGIGRLAASQREERYYLPKDDLYLVGSAEHTLAPLHMNETLAAKDCPKRYAGFSTCFRREAGSYGKDTKGILRVHQFDKVEMFSFSTAEDSEKEHRHLLDCQEKLMRALEIPYRVVEICTGDMGWADARQYDVEAWFAGQGVYRETHSCSNTTDFQARGIGVRYKTGKGEKRYAHLLNATAFAVGRTIAALMETHQTEKGAVKVPKVLQGYVGKKEIGKDAEEKVE
ncbi:serine--tRNA ligase [Candidatus Jorgensenbacteria bacterium CG10_big_fil_rev_8_21_14_0_10_54_38]|uniref:Serine--tRNA ligase n=2 Tax=Candidatus Joergenseniibacteriota TaxID=1752739 RepID=A0A2M6WFJ8_9BACT|nr:MAG: serine--tRNA ligase [Candidatus Jorgensenbacteria bacterium CG23_combo_of_CG06-09_8_20_14_all_54_14]PIT91545.1 MAG: serine--tRNA ligase [Candidatus Jorgensenbacteria bacterium CG10_big_fil_rev_8_21_14_0_10_54_38]